MPGVVHRFGLRLAAGLLATMALLVPVSDEVAVSVAVRVWLPALRKVALNVPTPLLSVLSDGGTAWPSLLVKCTVPP